MHRRDFLQSGASQHAAAPGSVAGTSVDAPAGVPRLARSRRGFLQIAGGVVLSNLTGCAGWKFSRRPPKCELPTDLPMSDLVAHLNANTDQINSWESTNVNVKAEGAMLLPSLSADLAIERPRNFRLVAKAVNSVWVDLGSNQDRFWFWDKSNNLVLTALHERMAAAQQQLPLPFEPDWLIEALGVIPLDENEIEFEKHPTEPKRVLFKRQRKTPDGTPVELVSTVDSCLGVILEHSLINRAGKVIALAKMSEHERDGKSKIVLAHSIALSWPQAQLGLRIRIGAIETNPQLPKQLFVMPDMKCEVVDIGGDRVAPQRVVHEVPEPRVPRRGKARL